MTAKKLAAHLPLASEISSEDATAMEKALRRQADTSGWYQIAPEEKAEEKLSWAQMNRPGIKRLADEAGKKIVATLLPKDPRKNKKRKNKKKKRRF